MQPATQTWGQDLLLNFAACPRQSLTNPTHTRAWTGNLIASIKMRAFGEPSIEHFATHSYGSARTIVTQLLDTPSIGTRFAEIPGRVFLDIFACTPLDDTETKEVCRTYFTPTMVAATPMSRGTFAHKLAEAG